MAAARRIAPCGFNLAAGLRDDAAAERARAGVRFLVKASMTASTALTTTKVFATENNALNMEWLLLAGRFVDDLADLFGWPLTFMFVEGEAHAGRDKNGDAEGDAEKCRSIVHVPRPFITSGAERRRRE
ncbi:MAG: hypothetical protein QM698_07260 [Micropepsaceae bacterium]